MNRENKTPPAHRRESKFSWKKVLAALGVFALIAVIAVGVSSATPGIKLAQ